jgi:hypothetical protein
VKMAEGWRTIYSALFSVQYTVFISTSSE